MAGVKLEGGLQTGVKIQHRKTSLIKTRVENFSKPFTFNNSVSFLHIALAAARDLFNMYSLQYLNVLNLAVR